MMAKPNRVRWIVTCASILLASTSNAAFAQSDDLNAAMQALQAAKEARAEAQQAMDRADSALREAQALLDRLSGGQTQAPQAAAALPLPAPAEQAMFVDASSS